jgi:hypothetical protein
MPEIAIDPPVPYDDVIGTRAVCELLGCSRARARALHPELGLGYSLPYSTRGGQPVRHYLFSRARVIEWARQRDAKFEALARHRVDVGELRVGATYAAKALGVSRQWLGRLDDQLHPIFAGGQRLYRISDILRVAGERAAIAAARRKAGAK